MRKILFLFAIAGLMLGSCHKKTENKYEELDSLQKQEFHDSVVAQLDSMATIICEVSDSTQFAGLFSKSKIHLTADQKKAKVNYLIKQSDLDDLHTLQQKYVAMAYLTIDKTVHDLYNDADGDDYYDRGLAKLAAETDAENEKLAKKAAKAELNMTNAQQFFQDMKQRNRMDQFYIAEAAFVVEALYIISQDAELFMPSINDETAARLTKMLQTVIRAEQKIAEIHPELNPVIDALANIRDITATNSKELEEQINKAKVPLATAREALLK